MESIVDTGVYIRFRPAVFDRQQVLVLPRVMELPIRNRSITISRDSVPVCMIDSPPSDDFAPLQHILSNFRDEPILLPAFVTLSLAKDD